MDLRSPDFNHPLQGSLLWVYEGQTEFWGRVLAARAGLRNRQETLDKLALDAALVENRAGRSWKSLDDSTNDAVYMAGHSVGRRDWQRREDYYPEGVLLWLDVDARLREQSHGRFSLDDFAGRFFATGGAMNTVRTYDFDDVCTALNAVVPDNWAGFLRRHLDSVPDVDALAGLARAGWRLGYTDEPTETFRQDEADAGVSNLDYSIGMQVRPSGVIRSIAWNSPAFKAGLAPDDRIIEVNARPFTAALLQAAIKVSGSVPLTLTVDVDGSPRKAAIAYHGSLRYPHLVRIPGKPDRLGDLLSSRPSKTSPP
ncbi:MAG: PDZ domain-containing protein [Janthinobacterium lividum]